MTPEVSAVQQQMQAAPPPQNPVYRPTGVQFVPASSESQASIQQDIEKYAKPWGICLTCVPTGSIGLMMKTGSFEGIVEPGRAMYCPGWSSIKLVELCIKNHTTVSESVKTKDNTLVTIISMVQYSIMREKLYTAVFDTLSPMEMIDASIDSVLRTSIPELTLDSVYAAKKTIVDNISLAVKDAMEQRGYKIHKILITDVQPDPQILQSMNAINAERRQRDAAFDRGEADKIMQVMAAEAEAEAMQRAGAGMREMRKAMADGFAESVEALANSGTGYTIDKAMHMMMAAQYLDTLKEFAESGKASIVLPSGPGGVTEIQRQVALGFGSSSSSSASPAQA